MENYCSSFSLLVLLLNTITLCLCTPSATDTQSLVAFKTSIIFDPHAILSKNWSDDTPVCDWVGVSCGMRHHRVTALNLSAFHLAGTLSPHLGNLTFLRYFDISFNSFRGFLPSELSNLHRLKVMNAMVNEFSGEIPTWLGSLPQLQQLLLNNNSLSGRISPSLFNNSKLQILRMSYNHLSGNIPEEIGNTSSLQILKMSYNKLSGFIPRGIFNISSMQEINIANNSLRGSLPSDVCNNLPNLKLLYLWGNQLSGEIPPNICKCTHLQLLALSTNHLSGNIPHEIGSLSMLTELYLGINHFRGVLPPAIGNLSRLQLLSIKGASLTGRIPSSIFNISSLTYLTLANNSLSGSIPTFRNLPWLEELYLSYNKLTGWLPSDMCDNMPNIKTIYLHVNQLGGKFPPNIWKCRYLENLSLSENNFTGSIPCEIGNISMLRELYLAFNNFQGGVPSEMGNLSRLEIFNINNASLTGRIPSSIFNISSLRVLGLANNSLSGSIPTFYNLPHIEELYLYNNKLTGLLSSDMCDNMPNIKTLYLHHNQLEGQIPPNIWKCRYLENLSLSTNNFRGSIPCEIGNMSMLRELYLGLNNFQEGVPAEIGNISRLELLSIDDASLTGSIPSSIFNISTLRVLALVNNSLSGSIPTFHNLPQLEALYLSYNKLTGIIPSDIGNQRALSTLALNSNSLTGEIPSSLCNLKSLTFFSLSNNNMDGSIPECLGTLSRSLTLLHLRENHFGGLIPTKFAKGCSLESLRLSGNKLEGPLPQSLNNCENLVDLDVGNNRIQDKFPFWMETLPQLRVLILRSNKFNGTVLSTLRTKLPFSKLQVFDISKNGFTGSLSTIYFKILQDMVYGKKIGAEESIGSFDEKFFTLTLKGLELSFDKIMPNFTMIDWSSNRFSGPIPNSIGNLTSLMHLNLSHNFLTGHIPASLGNVTALESLDLSSNNLSGEIPSELAKLTFLAKLNLSKNNLSGQIPQSGQLSTFENSSYIGNSGLCGFPLTKKCEYPFPSLVNDGGSRSKRVPLEKYIVPTFISVIIFVIIVLVLIKRIKKKKVQQCGDVSLLEYRRISVMELERGTSSFSETNLLGRGSFGSVFEATLFDGLKVAVKVFNLQLERAVESFHTETEILSSIRHKNLVQVIGCCTNTEFKALILEYMPNGSLEKWLYSENSCLGLLQRLKVAMDVALAVEYLHHGYTFPIVHCDIKPSNVLLDEDMNARVCDFGISKLFDEGESVVHTKTLATIGYAAPEYGSEGKVSTNGDVYSYGILLLEIFAGKKPTHEMFSEEMSLKEWVRRAIQNDGISEVVVPGLVSQGDGYYNEKVNCVSSIFELAMKCLAFSAEERINMRQIVAALHKINAQLLATNQMH